MELQGEPDLQVVLVHQTRLRITHVTHNKCPPVSDTARETDISKFCET